MMVPDKEKIFPTVFVIILHYKNFENLLECVNSLRKSKYPNFRIVIVDNNSGYREKVVTSFPESFVIESKENVGFAKGNNLGIAVALRENADYIMLLNDDTVVEQDAITKLVDVLEEMPQAGSIQPLLLKYHDSSIIDSAGVELHAKGGAADITSISDRESLQEICGPCAAAALYRREVFQKVGMFDDVFFVIHEDNDLSIRMRLAGYRSYLLPSAIVYHKRGVSSRESRRNPLYGFYGGRNAMILALRYWPLRYLIIYFPLYILRYIFLLRWTKECGFSLNKLHKPLLESIRKRYGFQRQSGIRDIQKRWIAKKGYRYFFRMVLHSYIY